MMHGREKSDEAIVAGKPANEAERSAEEAVERRAEAKGNASQTDTCRTLSRASVNQGLERIRQRARSALRRHAPKVGAVCGKAARTDLCGGALSNERPYREIAYAVVPAKRSAEPGPIRRVVGEARKREWPSTITFSERMGPCFRRDDPIKQSLTAFR